MKKLIVLLLAAVLLSGCQLASEKRNESTMDDKLVGVFVTFDHLSLDFDMEGYLSDNGIPEDGVIRDGSEYEGRLYAEAGETGWSFPGYEGLIMGQMWRDDHWMGFSTEGFCGIDTHVTGSDTMDGIEETGIIYVPVDTAEFIFCSNPVYMTPDGEYYAVQGSSLGSELYSGSMSQTVSDEKTWTEDDVSYTYSAEFTTVVEGVKLADKVTLVQMSADHRELDRAEYVPGEMPESITPVAGTAYIIVEESAEGEITRTLYQPGDDSLQVFYQAHAVYCLPQFTNIQWAE